LGGATDAAAESLEDEALVPGEEEEEEELANGAVDGGEALAKPTSEGEAIANLLRMGGVRRNSSVGGQQEASEDGGCGRCGGSS
jgi:hypothetical protein